MHVLDKVQIGVVIRARSVICGVFRKKKIIVQVAAYNWVEGVD